MFFLFCCSLTIYQNEKRVVPPKWIQEPRDVQAIVGHDITLPCLVEGFPEPSTVWTRTNGKQEIFIICKTVRIWYLMFHESDIIVLLMLHIFTFQRFYSNFLMLS